MQPNYKMQYSTHSKKEFSLKTGVLCPLSVKVINKRAEQHKTNEKGEDKFA